MKRILLTISILWTCAIAHADINLSQIREAMAHDRAMSSTISNQFSKQYNTAQQSLVEESRIYNNLKLEVYSCDVDNMFRETYLLHTVLQRHKRVQETYNSYHQWLRGIDVEIERYRRLMETIRNLPPTIADVMAERQQWQKESSEPSQADNLLHMDIYQQALTDSLMQVADSLLAITDSISEVRDQTAFATLTDASDYGVQNLQLYMLSQEEQQLRDSCLTMGTYYLAILLTHRHLCNELNIQCEHLLEDYVPTVEYVNYTFDELQNKLLHGLQATIWQIWAHPNTYIKHIKQDCEFTYVGRDDLIDGEVLLVILLQMFGMLLIAVFIVRGLKRYCQCDKYWYKRLVQNPGIYANQIYMVLLTISLALDTYVWHYKLIEDNKMVFLAYFAYIFVIQTTLLARDRGKRATIGMHLYAPFIALGFAITFLRLFFVPDSALTFWFFPIALGCNIWQNIVLVRYWSQASKLDSILAGITTIVLLVTMIMVAIGYTLMGTLIVFWWQTQQVAVVIIVGLFRWTASNNKRVEEVKRSYLERTHGTSYVSNQQEAIQITWFHDFIRMAGIPIVACISLPLCTYASMAYYNGAGQFVKTFHQVFFSLGAGDNLVFNISLYNIVMVVALYFIFKYLQHICNALYKQIRMAAMIDEGKQYVPNLNLAHNIIGTTTWAIYILVICLIMNIPMQALTFIFAGLATGIGFALKDVLNNIIYGIQLISGRLSVGDYIICDGYRGAVTAISYQTTQMLTEENAVVSFTNSDLFSKNFQNLTKGNPYEINRVLCDIAYGSDIALAEKLMRDAIEPLNTKDAFGRPLLSPKDGLRIEMRDLGASGIQMAARFGVIAERRTWFLPIARKAIYQAFIDGGISIPFPQVEMHMVESFPAEKR